MSARMLLGHVSYSPELLIMSTQNPGHSQHKNSFQQVFRLKTMFPNSL